MSKRRLKKVTSGTTPRTNPHWDGDLECLFTGLFERIERQSGVDVTHDNPDVDDVDDVEEVT